jgi:hypothetical protein
MPEWLAYGVMGLGLGLMIGTGFMLWLLGVIK